MSLIASPLYSCDYVNGQQRLRVFDYDTASKVWTPLNTRRAQWLAEDDGYWLYIDEERSLYYTEVGDVGFGWITNRISINDFPRLEFTRQVVGQPQWFASISQRGIITVKNVSEDVPPSGTDRIFFTGGNITIGMDGLFCDNLTELTLLVDKATEFLTTEDGQVLTTVDGELLTTGPVHYLTTAESGKHLSIS